MLFLLFVTGHAALQQLLSGQGLGSVLCGCMETCFFWGGSGVFKKQTCTNNIKQALTGLHRVEKSI